ncbi:hypothetical protein LCGC14_0871620 [marine sediment metagenome]|uniref:Uncharacterized protein n=1 Tax=marine sediment metagenome TaxID=412755 RepID=A0A0F9P9D0_9ZZZZ
MKKDKKEKKNKKDKIQINSNWIIDYTYYKDEIIIYNNISYIALQETVGDYPNIDSNYWKAMENK